MLEDGEIEFEAYYRPAKNKTAEKEDDKSTECHPVIGQTAFMIRPDGIYLKTLSQGRYEEDLEIKSQETKADSSKTRRVERERLE